VNADAARAAVGGEVRPDLPAAGVQQLLSRTARPVDGDEVALGAGIVNALAAVRAARDATG